jgi:RNA polymerase sigma-70 factor (ECF subfamily)
MDDRAFEQAVTLHKDRVHSYATMMLRNRTEAQDVAQDALIRLWNHRQRVERRGARLWLMRTTHNLCIDRLRQRKVRAEIPDGETVMEAKPDATPDPQQLAHSTELGRLIERELGALSPPDRAVLVMREVQGLPYDEIAQALELPLGTLKARLHRAREKLRARLTRAGVAP